MAKPKRPRTERRDAERGAVKIAKAGLKLSALEAGGSEDLPIIVGSASVIEPHAASIPCAACGESVRVKEHRAVAALRVVRVECPHCGVFRDLYFRIAHLN